MLSYATYARSLGSHQSAASLYENEKEVLLELEFPGRKREDIEIDVKQDHLHVTAKEVSTAREGFELSYSEAQRGQAERRFRLGSDLEAEKIQANFENGLLSIHIPKHERAAVRKIAIQ
jgi:HSP20 family protein